MTIWMPATLDPRAPIYASIARSIETDVLAGRLRPGDRLPTHRDLARRVGVTVGTVSRAYAEARTAGWISGEVGRGTFVRDRRAGRFADRREARSDGVDLSMREARSDGVDLSMNVPIDEPAPDLAAALRGLAAAPDVASLLRYAPTRGARRDREAGAAVLERHGLAVDPENVVVCAGAQHGVGAALEAASRPGDNVLAEELTYPGLRPLAEARGLRVHPVAIDDEGVVARSVDLACRRTKAKALYLVPTLHNPTGSTLSRARREAIAEIARRHGLVVIEDDIHRLLSTGAPPPIAHFAPERTIHVASLSKCFVPGLRVGYLAAPPALRDRVADAVWRSIWMTSPVATALATRWVLSGDLDSIAAGKRREAAARQALAAKVLSRDRVPAPTTAYHLWLSTGPRWSGDAFAHEARARGVGVTPATAFHLGSGPPPAAVRVSLSAAPNRSVLAAALERLRQVLERSAPSAPPTL
ncbi:MAG TPA: PLP-dependent aminotransferase family protein [Planctomycetota bacterium]|nr:PLP-dependent aminotransferase family protein [Planctomycetota bacterium]